MAALEKNISQHVLNALMLLSVLLGVIQIASYATIEMSWEFESNQAIAIYVVLITVLALCFIELIALNRQANVRKARLLTRVLVALLLFAFTYDALFIEGTPLSSVLVFQFILVITHQMKNDPNLDRHNPQEGGYKGYIPLSFFNLFWIFVICSIVGLFGETVVSYFRDGRWESRAGLVFGPLSPIYGMGGVLITAALNRLYDRNVAALFAIGGIVGASFEYFAGWFWESAFGIVAWSYEGQPFNFHGHTSLLMACVWGLVGVLWMKFALPPMMRLIDRIPLGARVSLTTACATVLLVDAVLTVICLDCWYQRKIGTPIGTPWQEFCATYFNDEFMQARFETMSMWPTLANR